MVGHDDSVLSRWQSAEGKRPARDKADCRAIDRARQSCAFIGRSGSESLA
jgi:hypothetical protein